jgi:hypothetical protein
MYDAESISCFTTSYIYPLQIWKIYVKIRNNADAMML